ncbi:hypothetical protein DK847_17970 [Aestuariivirga litoralis]|uniref:Uncharacterized protein n=1 Tax=Aestuariivirga litoralis TaxID=2650924 RepID=A0A2W2BPS5_9HYPH|nr:hypothetical protein [Aestuariivirga litoralis]PZF75406.1 hypothetical protein DK847_17970 [Aestuariivirga litoralis]
MDGTTLLEHLEWAERYVTEGLIHIRRQTLLIEALERAGRDSSQARRILDVLEKAQLDHVAARDRLAEEMRNTPAPQPDGPELGT